MTSAVQDVAGRQRSATARAGRRGLTAKVLAYLFTFGPLLLLSGASDLPTEVRNKGALLWILSMLPALLYVTRRPARREPVPAFPLISATVGLYYALPAITGSVNLAFHPHQFGISYLDPAQDFSHAVDIALVGWGCALLGYWLVAVLYRPRGRAPESWPAVDLTPMLVRIIIAGTAAEALQTAVALPTVIVGAVAFGAVLSRFAIATMVALRAKRQLDARGRLVLAVVIPLQLLLIVASGSISGVFLFVILLLAAQYLAGGTIRLAWLVAGLAVAATLITLKGVLAEYRREAWFTTEHLTVVERVNLMNDLMRARIQAQGPAGALESGFLAAASRSGTLDLLADAMIRTPKEIPYWGGSGYFSLIGFAIPRILWPNKPTKTLGQDFGHRYGYLDPRDLNTSVNLPYLVEFYINFGELGVWVGMFMTGMIYRVADNVFNVRGQHLVRSLAGVSILLPLLNVESDFSLVFGGLFLNAVAFGIVLRYLKRRLRASASRRTRARAIAKLEPHRMVGG